MDMKTRFARILSSATVFLYSAAAFAGSSSGGGPAGDAGSSGSEPALYALILLTMIPGFYLANRARNARMVPVRKNR